MKSVLRLPLCQLQPLARRACNDHTCDTPYRRARGHTLAFATCYQPGHPTQSKSGVYGRGSVQIVHVPPAAAMGCVREAGRLGGREGKQAAEHALCQPALVESHHAQRHFVRVADLPPCPAHLPHHAPRARPDASPQNAPHQVHVCQHGRVGCAPPLSRRCLVRVPLKRHV